MARKILFLATLVRCFRHRAFASQAEKWPGQHLRNACPVRSPGFYSGQILPPQPTLGPPSGGLFAVRRSCTPPLAVRLAGRGSLSALRRAADWSVPPGAVERGIVTAITTAIRNNRRQSLIHKTGLKANFSVRGLLADRHADQSGRSRRTAIANSMNGAESHALRARYADRLGLSQLRALAQAMSRPKGPRAFSQVPSRRRVRRDR